MSRTATATEQIDADIEDVWRLMMDLEGYARWNPFVVKVAGPSPVVQGSTLKLRARLAPGLVSRVRVRVTALAPPSDDEATLVYEVVGPMALAVKATRSQTLVALAEGRCRYTTSEVFDGPAHALIPFRLVQRGTERHASALKRTAENR